MATNLQGRVVKRYRFKGPYAGRDLVLGDFQFTGGEALIGLGSDAEHESLARFFWYYQAEEVKGDGHGDVQANGPAEVVGDVRSDGIQSSPDSEAAGNSGGHGEAAAVQAPGRVVSGGPGQAESVDLLKAAILGLDHENASHWTASGRPAIAAVEDAFGAPVTRAKIEAAAPGFVRKARA